MRARDLSQGEAVLAEDAKVLARERVRKHRAILRARGLRPLQIWVPDLRSPVFAAAVKRECEAINSSTDESAVLEFIEQSMDYSGWV